MAQNDPFSSLRAASSRTGMSFFEKGSDAYKEDQSARKDGLTPGRSPQDQQWIDAIREEIKAGVRPDDEIELLMHRNPRAAGMFSASVKIRDANKRFQEIAARNTFGGVVSPFQQQGPTRPGAEQLPVIPEQGPSFNQPQALQMLAQEGLLTPERQASIKGLGEAFEAPEEKQPLVNVDMRKTHPFIAQLEKKQADKFTEDMEGAESARDSLDDIQKASDIMNQGIITGFGGNFILGTGKLLQQAGMISDDPDNTVANTEAFFANQGKATAQEIKAFGAGTGLSDADREFAKGIAGGDISMTENSIKKILKLRTKVATLKIKRFNKRADAVDKRFKGRVPYSMKIELPKVTFGSGAPPGVDPEDWKHLTEEQKKLWRK